MIYKKDTIIEVEWDDTSTIAGWHDENKPDLIDYDGLCKCKTVGYFLRESKKSIQLSGSLTNGADGRGETTTILRSCITKIRKLRR